MQYLRYGVLYRISCCTVMPYLKYGSAVRGQYDALKAVFFAVLSVNGTSRLRQYDTEERHISRILPRPVPYLAKPQYEVIKAMFYAVLIVNGTALYGSTALRDAMKAVSCSVPYLAKRHGTFTGVRYGVVRTACSTVRKVSVRHRRGQYGTEGLSTP